MASEEYSKLESTWLADNPGKDESDFQAYMEQTNPDILDAMFGEGIVEGDKEKFDIEFIDRMKKKGMSDEEAAAKLAEYYAKIEERIPEGKEVKVYHGTRHQYKSDIFKTPDNVLYTTRNPHEASLFAKNASPQDFGTYSTGARVYPLRIKKNAKIFDPSRDDHWKKLMEDNGFKQWIQNMHTKHNQLLVDEPIDMIRDPKKFRKLFRKNKYFGQVGHFIEDEALQPILKRHGFHGFTVREAGEVNVGMFLDSEGGSDMLKYLHEKYKGGMIERNPYQKEMRAI